MIDYQMICTRCKIEKHVWSGNRNGFIHSTIPAEFSEKHLKKGCCFKDLHFCGDYSQFYQNLDIENYKDDEDNYDDDFYDFD